MIKMIKMKLSEFQRVTKALKECLKANKALNEQNERFNNGRKD